MEFAKIRIKAEEMLYNILWTNFAGDTLLSLLPASSQNDSLAHLLSGEYLQVTKELTPDIYKIFQEALESLDFHHPINLYISGNKDINASILPSHDPEDPHIIIINSGLADILTADEIKFVIGHEIGHLAFDSLNLDRLLDFIFAEKESFAGYNLKITTWKKLVELNADRLGLLACQDLNTAASALFKISSGMNPTALGIDMDKYIKNFDLFFENYNSDIIEKDLNGSHPLISIRVKMLEHFSGTSCFSEFISKKKLINGSDNEEEYRPLLLPILIYGDSPINNMRKKFIAISGIIAATSDGELNEDELQTILGALSGFDLFPRVIMKLYANMSEKQLIATLTEAIDFILNENPEENIAMIHFLCRIIISDNAIKPEEVLFLLNFAGSYLHLNKNETLRVIAGQIHDGFTPNL